MKFSFLETTINELEAKNQLVEEKLKMQCATANAKMKHIDSKYEKLKAFTKKLMTEHQEVKCKFVKTIRPNQLTAVKRIDGSDVILGQGRFGTCKLMIMGVSGDKVMVAVKEYCSNVQKQQVIEEAALLNQLSHPAFPFVFGVVFETSVYKLVLEFLGFSEGERYSLCIHKALLSSDVLISEFNWLIILKKCCEGFDYLHSHGIIHNDIKADNILIVQSIKSWDPKIIDFNKAVTLENCKKRIIPDSDQTRYKALYKHVDPAIYEGICTPCKDSDVYSFGYMAKQISKVLQSELIERLSISCMSKVNRPSFIKLHADIKTLTDQLIQKQ